MMEKLSSFLKNGLAELTFAALALRIVVTGATIGDAIALFAMVGIFGFFRYMDRNKMDQFNELKQEIENIKSAMTSVKLAQGIKTTGAKNEDKTNRRYF